MQEKIAFIAIGQAGGNLGQLLEQKGYMVLYVNTSKEDLSTLEGKFKYHISGGEGCHKDRNKAKQLVIEDYDQIAAELESKLKAELIFVLFSSGGGTGSGAGPMLIDLLLDETRTTAIGAVTVLPGPEESVKAHINCYECFQELTAIDRLAACFILDNGKGEKLSINERFVSDFCAFLEIPQTHTSVRGNIDQAEILETLRAHGMSLVARREAEDSAQFLPALKEHPYADLEGDRTVAYLAGALSGTVSMQDLEKALGTPVDTFQTYRETETVCCCSGLSFPMARLARVYQKVAENRETIKKNLAAARETALREHVNFLEDLGADVRPQPRKPQSKRDIMSKYLN